MYALSKQEKRMRTVTNISHDEQPFRIRAYGLQELAMLYFPNSAPRSASAQLKRWIMRNPVLLSRLLEAGYYHGQRILTPRQVRVVVEELDAP